ncbi:MAG: Cof-type HAD-IIB family hydrolase [Bacillota bacterium]|jgi:HAD superfamily hydrolase (TIGR01484 family)|nr:Cof-type HAD-IIB family hydrolase [Bacillota bacterium]HHT90919.1 HAD family phosphatase [Bacillota bacterium]
MFTYKLIALDLDGTLLDNKQEISAQNLEWIAKAEQAGLIVSIATGRGRRWSEQYWSAVSPTSPMVLVNGSEIWRDHQHILARHLLPADQVARLIDVAKEHGAGYWAIGSASDGGASLKVGIHHEDLAIISKLRDLLMSLGEFEVSASAPTNIEINPKGVSKATGLAEVAALYGIAPSEVVAVGDSRNDLAMLQWAGLGVAMGNAEPVVKEAADYIAASNEEDGVAQVIRLALEQMG